MPNDMAFWLGLGATALAVFLALARVKSLEGLRYCAPGEWGKVLGLDREQLANAVGLAVVLFAPAIGTQLVAFANRLWPLVAKMSQPGCRTSRSILPVSCSRKSTIAPAMSR